MTPGLRLYLITDRHLASAQGGLLAAVEAALRAASPPGSVALQVREKDMGGRELYGLARELRLLCSRYRAPLLINDRIDVALVVGADGVHLPADSFAVADARRLVGPTRLIGVSVHEPGEVASAAADGADFAVFGPVYDPLSKAAYGPAGGGAGLAAACAAAPGFPVYALGGITAEHVNELAGAVSTLFTRGRPAGVAVIGAVFGADDPGGATRDLLKTVAKL